MAVPFGKYQLLKKIASGGMGQVFLARSEGAGGFEKFLVIKRILPALAEDKEFLDMFFDEARLTARLNHPNVVQIFEIGEVAGSHYLAMEYVPGDDLRHVHREAISQDKIIPLGVLCRVIADAAAGLDYAHKARDGKGNLLGVIHRDVSPQNVLLGFDGGVKLIDFGVARAADRLHHTTTGTLKGKYAYMSPEQVDWQPIDHRSDIFALGTVFWELLAGRRLFKSESDVQTMKMIRECNVTPPSKLNEALPSSLDGLVLRALSRAPGDRFQDAAAFRMAIEDFIVTHHLSGSSAHVMTFLHDVYGERVERAKAPAALDELDSSAVLDEIATPASIGTGVSNQAQGAPPVRSRRRRVRQLGLGAVLIAGSAAIGLGGGLRVWHERKPAAPSAPLLVPAAPATVTPGQPPAVPGSVSLTLISEPSGARVQLNGRDTGTTPLTIQTSQQDAPMTATFSLPGFEPVASKLSAKNAPLVYVQLKKMP